jgi:serine/threonine-protein kinase RsbW
MEAGRAPATGPQAEFDADKLLLQLDIRFRADPDAINPVVLAILQASRYTKCMEEHTKELAIETALHEALMNAIVHGCKNDRARYVQCSVMCDERCGVLIVVRDPGEGFDPKKLASPVKGKQLYADHGRGVYLINRMMDEVHFEKGGAEIHMRKY